MQFFIFLKAINVSNFFNFIINVNVTKYPEDILFFIATFLYESLDSCWEKSTEEEGFSCVNL